MVEYTKFAVDCFNLWRAGYVYLPRVADAYAEASKYLDATSGGSMSTVKSELLTNDRSLGKSAARESWTELRNLTQNILANSSRNLYTVGDVLVEAARTFAEKDTEHGNEIGSASKQLDDQITEHKDDVKADNDKKDGEDKTVGRPDDSDLDSPSKHVQDIH